MEHSSGLMKLGAERLTPEYAARLGLGWKPVLPDAPQLKQTDLVNVELAKQAVNKAATPEEREAGKKLEAEEVTKAFAKVEADLSKAQKAFDDERANLRMLSIYKPDMKPSSGPKTYGTLKKESNARLAILAGKVQTLQSQRRSLENQMKSFK